MRLNSVLDILRCFDLPNQDHSTWVVTPYPKSRGFSQSRIWQIECAAQATALVGAGPAANSRWCLRSWPLAEPGSQRLRWIHQQAWAAAQQCSFILAPVFLKQQTETFIEYEGRLWHLEPWAIGHNDFHQPERSVRMTRLASVMHSLAKLHQCWLGAPSVATSILLEPSDAFGRAYAGAGPSPGLENRMQHLNELVGDGSVIFELAREYWRKVDTRRSGLGAKWCTVIDHIEQHWHANHSNCRTQLEQRLGWKFPLGPILADVWSDHLFFVEDRLSSIIDYGAMRIDTAAADLSRCLSSLCGQNIDELRYALQEYEAVRPLVDAERAAIQVFDESSRLLGPMVWLRWLFVERRMAPSEIILQRLQCLLEGHPF